MAVTLQFQSTGHIPGKGEPVQMHGASLTIGRGNDNDMVLPDPDRGLSKRHCVIEDHNGNVVVVDISSNGTFLNYGKLALGATPTPLNNGDILSLGPYEILVEITQEDKISQISDPLEVAPVSHGEATNALSRDDLLDAPGDRSDFLDDLLSGRDGLVGPASVNRDETEDNGLLPPLSDDDPLPPLGQDPYEGQGASASFHSPSTQDHFPSPRSSSGSMAIPDDWDDDFLKPNSTGTQTPSNPFVMQPSGAPTAEVDSKIEDLNADNFDNLLEDPVATTSPTVEKQFSQSEPVAAPSKEPSLSASQPNEAAARAFLKALGVDDDQVMPDDLNATLSKLGHVLRIMVKGMREILMTRTSIKSEFRIEQTMIQAGGNNPLKFSISPEQAIEAMVKPSPKGYLDAAAAAEQALNDVKAHEVAMVTGMESALRGILSRLDPAALEEKIVLRGGVSGMLKNRKARYWETYENMYAEIADQAENDFQELFAREFARAYKEQLDKLK